MLPHTLYMPNTRKHPIPNIEHGALSTVEFVVIHINVGSTTGTFDWWSKPGHEPDGAQVQVSKDGTAYQTMALDRKAWHAGAANDKSIGFEHEGFPGKPHPDVQLHASANRVAWVHHECKLGRPIRNKTVFPHSWGGGAWGGHACPGADWPWDKYMALCMTAYMEHWGR